MSIRAKGQCGVDRGFDDVRGDSRDAAVRGIRIEVDHRRYRYPAHQGSDPGARLLPERSLTPPVHRGLDRRCTIEACAGFGRGDLEGLVSRGEGERLAGILREVLFETGAGIRRGKTAEIQTGDLDPLIDATLVGRGVEGQSRGSRRDKERNHQQRPGQQARDFLRASGWGQPNAPDSGSGTAKPGSDVHRDSGGWTKFTRHPHRAVYGDGAIK